MATIRDVAERAGVAPSTVSFVMNGRPWVSEEVRKQVQVAVRELNYTQRQKGRPKKLAGNGKAAVRLKNQMALLIPEALATLRVYLTYLNVLHGVETTCSKLAKHMLLQTVTAAIPFKASALASKIDGFIFMGDASPTTFSGLLGRVPAVRVMGVPEDGQPWDHVTYDNGRIGRLAAEYLLGRGHRHAAYLSPFAGIAPPQLDPEHSFRGTPFHKINPGRQQAFIETMEAAGAGVCVNPRGEAQWLPQHPEKLAALLRELLLTDPRPTGLFIPNDDVTKVAYEILPSLGIRPGVDIDIISCDNNTYLIGDLKPRPASIEIATQSIGSRGVSVLLNRLENPDLPWSVTLLDPRIILGEGVWPAQAKAEN